MIYFDCLITKISLSIGKDILFLTPISLPRLKSEEKLFILDNICEFRWCHYIDVLVSIVPFLFKGNSAQTMFINPTPNYLNLVNQKAICSRITSAYLLIINSGNFDEQIENI